MACPALATPDQNLWVNDTLFAATPDTVLILRTISDNHGSYYTTQTDTFLLEVSRADGAVLQVSAVERVVQIAGLQDDLDETTFYPLEGALNPFERRAELGAAPLAPPRPSQYRAPMLLPTGLIVFEETVPTHSIGLNALRDQLVTSLTLTRAVLPIMHRVNGYDPFAPATLALVGDCMADRVTPIWFSRGADKASALARLTCENFESGGISTYWTVVPKAD
jgi:hypothetical protein